MKVKYIKNFLTVFVFAFSIIIFSCSMPLDEYSSSSSDLRNIAGLKNRSAISKMPFMGGAALYNPSDLSTSQLDKGAVLGVRLGKIQQKDVGAAQPVYSDINDEAIFGYITIEDISRERVSFSYYEFENEKWSDSESASLKNTFTLEAGKSCDLNSDGIDDVSYIKPFTKRKGSEKSMWLAFLNADENIKVSSMFSVIPQQYARSAYPGGLIGINPEGRYIVNKYDIGTTNRAAVKSVIYGDYVIDTEQTSFATFVGSKSFSGARALNDEELKTIEVNEDDSPEMYYFQNAEFTDNYSIYELLEAMPASVVTKDFKSLSIADAVEYLNELAKNPDLWKKLVEGNSSGEANEIRENLSEFYGDSELHIVIANRKALSVLYPDLCPQLSTYSSSFAMIFPWFSAYLGDIKDSDSIDSSRAAKKANPILSDDKYTDEYKEFVRKRDAVSEEFSHLLSFDILPCIVGSLKSPVLKKIVSDSDSSVRIGVGGSINCVSANPKFNIKMCLLFKYEFKDAIRYSVKTTSLFTSDEIPAVLDTKNGEALKMRDYGNISDEEMKEKLAENKKELEKEFGIDNFSWLGFKEVGEFRSSPRIRPTKDAKNFHKSINVCPPLPLVFTFDATFDILLSSNVLVEFKNVSIGGIYMIGFGVESGIRWSFIKKWMIPVGLKAEPYTEAFKISQGANFAGITTKDKSLVQFGGGAQFMLAPVLELRAGFGVGADFGVISADFTLGAPIGFVLPISVYVGATTGNGNYFNFVAETQGNFKATLGLDLQFCLDPPFVRKRVWQWPLWTAIDFNAQLWKVRTENFKVVSAEGPKVVSFNYPFKN